MANLLTCEQLNEDRCPCQSLVSLSWGRLYERVRGQCKSRISLYFLTAVTLQSIRHSVAVGELVGVGQELVGGQ